MSEKSKLFAIAVLAVTAVLMLCTMVILDRMPVSPAYAGHSPDRKGDYVMVSGLTSSGDECIYILDIATAKVGIYRADLSRGQGQVLPLGGISLAPTKP
jgi:hypothetical protein